MNRFELWDKVARCRLQQHFRLLVAVWSHPIGPTIEKFDKAQHKLMKISTLKC